MTPDTKVREILIEMVEKIKKDYRPEKIILFGSYVHGTPDKDSDIDLLIIKDSQDRPIDRRVTVSRILSDPERLIPVEPIVMTGKEVAERLDMGDEFIKEIFEKGEVLYAA